VKGHASLPGGYVQLEMSIGNTFDENAYETVASQFTIPMVEDTIRLGSADITSLADFADGLTLFTRVVIRDVAGNEATGATSPHEILIDVNPPADFTAGALVATGGNVVANSYNNSNTGIQLDVPLVADMSSTILSRPLDVDRFGMIYAGAQKNIGPAGLTLVIIREDLVGDAMPGTPTMFNYKTHVDNDSMYNTPPTYGWYLAGLVFQWLKDKGGLQGMAEINSRKANKLYDAIDTSDFYANPVDPHCRSWMNVPFTLANAELDKTFLEEASAEGLKTLKGHRSVGGMRASIYNAMPEEGIDALVGFMAEFERKYG